MEHLSVELDTQTCAELMASDTVGRVAFVTDRGPRVTAVVYHCTGPRIAFCASEDSEVARWAPGRQVALQVDLVDRGLLRGWTVSATGECRILEAPQDHLCRAWSGDQATITLGLLEPVLTGRWVGDPSRSQ